MHPDGCIAINMPFRIEMCGSISHERLVGVMPNCQIENGEWKMENEAAFAAVTSHYPQTTQKARRDAAPPVRLTRCRAKRTVLVYHSTPLGVKIHQDGKIAPELRPSANDGGCLRCRNGGRPGRGRRYGWRRGGRSQGRTRRRRRQSPSRSIRRNIRRRCVARGRSRRG